MEHRSTATCRVDIVWTIPQMELQAKLSMLRMLNPDLKKRSSRLSGYQAIREMNLQRDNAEAWKPLRGML
ncbi:hypothetical protein N7461_008989 [Penicillium sp. DV-2018c]|nr:hypothetical protein N7461_008989 [Penicillium sp. DV-2018c]